MLPILLHDRSEIEAALRRNTYLNLYEIGDLDDFFWPYTTWYAFPEHGSLRQVLLVYTGSDPPVLLGTADQDLEVLLSALRLVRRLLPGRFYAHLTPGGEQAFCDGWQAETHGLHHKMALTAPEALSGIDTSHVSHLTLSDQPALLDLYQSAYPGNWFDPRMLETGCYYGVRQGERILSVAGVHVFSPRYRVAAIGNITTHPDYRGQGLGTQVTAHLCRELTRQVDHIGLNVRTDNAAAIACYRRLGFSVVADYEEFMFLPPEHRVDP